MFEIDFFELMFLAESIIPQRPIARAVAFDRLSDVHYHKMTKNERKQFFYHVIKCHSFDLSDEQCAHFYARFNPENQYIVTTKCNGKTETHEAYIYLGVYHISKTRFIGSNFITKVEKLQY